MVKTFFLIGTKDDHSLIISLKASHSILITSVCTDFSVPKETFLDANELFFYFWFDLFCNFLNDFIISVQQCDIVV